MSRGASMWKLLVGILLLSALAAVALDYLATPPWSQRAPTSGETTLYYFAQELGEPKLCGRIAWDAYESKGGWFKGGSSRWRSSCYEQLAISQHAEPLCWEARPYLDLDPSSVGYSAVGCTRRIHGGTPAHLKLSDAEVVQAFRGLGYDLDDMHLEGVIQPPVRPADTYEALLQDPAAVSRARSLLESGSSQPEDRNYLADLVALADGDAAHCSAIPLTQLSVHQQAPLRDWCYFTVAYNKGDARICAAMTPAAKEPKVIAAEASGVQPGIAEGMSLHAQCMRSGAYGTQRQYRYAPELPTDPDQLLRLLKTLDAAPQRAASWPVEKQAAYLRDVLAALALRTPPDAARDSARSDLVQRLLKQP